MSDEPELILQRLKDIRSDLRSIRETQLEHTHQLGCLERSVSILLSHGADHSMLIDRVSVHLDTIEKRLGMLGDE